MCIIRYGRGVITVGSDAYGERCASRLVTDAVLCVICVMQEKKVKEPRFRSARSAECTGLKSIWKRPGGCVTMQSK